MKDNRNTVKAIELAKDYALLDNSDIKAVSAKADGQLYELNVNTEYLTYVFFVDITALEVMGFDCCPMTAI